MVRGRRSGSSRKRKKGRQNQNDNGVGGEDRLSSMPDAVLLYIMSFMRMRDAVQTCLLSKRWEHLWKCIPDVILHASEFSRECEDFHEFVYCFASCNDRKHPLNSLDFIRHGYFPDQILTRLLTYAVSYEIQKLKIVVPCNTYLPSCLFSCQTLTSLDISAASPDWKRTIIPNSLELPSLVSLRIERAVFTVDGNGNAEPFSTCPKLNTLTLDHIQFLSHDFGIHKKVTLIVSNAKLANLTINKYCGQEIYYRHYFVVVSAPNLSSFTFNGSPFQNFLGQEGTRVELRSSSLA